MNKTLKKRLAIGLVSLSLSSFVIPSVSNMNVYASEFNNSDKIINNFKKSESFRRVKLMSKLNTEIKYSEFGIMSLDVTDQYLIEKYHFDKSDISLVRKIIYDYNEGVYATFDRAYIDDYHLILDKNDLVGILTIVNQLGPVALAGALAAATSVVPGAGTVVGAVIGFFGASAIIGNAAYAVATNRKLRLGLTGVSVID